MVKNLAQVVSFDSKEHSSVVYAKTLMDLFSGTFTQNQINALKVEADATWDGLSDMDKSLRRYCAMLCVMPSLTTCIHRTIGDTEDTGKRQRHYVEEDREDGDVPSPDDPMGSSEQI